MYYPTRSVKNIIAPTNASLKKTDKKCSCINAPSTGKPVCPQKWRILVVDDEPRFRLVLQEILKAKHQTVETASSVTEAIALVQMKKYDLLITDFNMPDGKGTEIIKAARVDNNTLHTIMITGEDLFFLADHIAPEETPEAFIGKPFNLENLFSVITSFQQGLPLDSSVKS